MGRDGIVVKGLWAMKPTRKQRKEGRGRRKNPAFGVPLDISKMLANTAGNLAITQAVQGATLEEKLILSAILPGLLAVIRNVPKADLDGAIAKAFPEGLVIGPQARQMTMKQMANGAGYVLCSCGWQSQVVDDGKMYDPGWKSASQLFAEHICLPAR